MSISSKILQDLKAITNASSYLSGHLLDIARENNFLDKVKFLFPNEYVSEETTTQELINIYDNSLNWQKNRSNWDTPTNQIILPQHIGTAVYHGTELKLWDTVSSLLQNREIPNEFRGLAVKEACNDKNSLNILTNLLTNGEIPKLFEVKL